MWHGHPFNKLPIIEGDVGKNKITEFTGRHHFKFFPAQSRYECLSPDEAFSISETNKMGSETQAETRDWVWKNGKRVSLVTTPKTDSQKAKLSDSYGFKNS